MSPVASEDPFDDPGWRAYVTHVRSELVPMIDSSAMTISLAPSDPSKVDVKFALELGLSIMLNKPILVVIDEDGMLPAMLEKIAVAVVRGSLDDPATQQAITAALAIVAEVESSDDDAAG